MKANLICAAAIGVVGSLALASAAMADFVVIRSNAPDIERGQVLTLETPLTLAAGKRLTLLDDAGKPVRLTGPYTGPMGKAPGINPRQAGGGKVSNTIARLLNKRGEASQLGAIRAIGGGPAEDPWVINVTRAGRYCVKPGETPRLWRPNASKAGTVSLKRQPASQRARLKWQQGVSVVNWPVEDIPPRDGGVYFAQLQGSLSATRIEIHFLPKGLAGVGRSAAWMADAGCTDQALALLDRIQ